MTDSVVLCECFARDGLQHEPDYVPVATKLDLLRRFADIGFKRIEATNFTHPGNVPQFTDAEEVLKALPHRPDVRYKSTCINMRSVDRALAVVAAGCGTEEASVVIGASEAMNRRAFNRSGAELRELIGAMIARLLPRFPIVVGTVSFAFGSVYDGAVPLERVLATATWLREQGVRHIAIGDTTGMGQPRSIRTLFEALRKALPDVVPIAHFHDTRGLGLANCVAAYEAGVRHFDCAFGGAGGNPAKISYAEGYTGNVCTEDLAAMFESMGIATGLDLDALVPTGKLCEEIVGHTLYSRVTRSGLGLLDASLRGPKAA